MFLMPLRVFQGTVDECTAFMYKIILISPVYIVRRIGKVLVKQLLAVAAEILLAPNHIKIWNKYSNYGIIS